jgi:hypothetical protein
MASRVLREGLKDEPRLLFIFLIDLEKAIPLSLCQAPVVQITFSCHYVPRHRKSETCQWLSLPLPPIIPSHPPQPFEHIEYSGDYTPIPKTCSVSSNRVCGSLALHLGEDQKLISDEEEER